MLRRGMTLLLALMLTLTSSFVSTAPTRAAEMKSYLVVFKGQQAVDGSFTMTLSPASALSLVTAAGGTVSADLTRQVGVLAVRSANGLFASTLSASPFVEAVGEDFGWKAFMSYQEAVSSGTLVRAEAGGGGPEQTADPLEPEQWSMQQIRAPEAHTVQAGWRAVDVGILDSGVDGRHLDFDDDGVAGGPTNVDCARGRDFVAVGPGVGNPDPCTDNQFHGTHVAGIVAAQANGVGVVGVAPNVTLVPVKVCDTAGYCYASSVVAGITYAGDARLDVINMSFFVDDNELLTSTEFKCMNDAAQRAFRRAVERAIQYARSQGVTPVAALGNSDTDLDDPPAGNECEVVPAESSGVVGTMALGPTREKAGYSNYGVGATDVGAPGGNGTTGDCLTTVLSTFPGNVHFCIQGTSMASPHTAGVAALIVSQYGTLGPNGDVEMPPTRVEAFLQDTTVDLGEPGYDQCFGHGRIDALRAVLHDTGGMAEPNPPCPEM